MLVLLRRLILSAVLVLSMAVIIRFLLITHACEEEEVK